MRIIKSYICKKTGLRSDIFYNKESKKYSIKYKDIDANIQLPYISYFDTFQDAAVYAKEFVF